MGGGPPPPPGAATVYIYRARDQYDNRYIV